MSKRWENYYLRNEREERIFAEKFKDAETIDCRKCKVKTSIVKWFKDKFRRLAWINK